VACCDEFIDRLPEGINTVLAENGGSLSGGERQRLSIARAILKNAPVVILDEATAALDTRNEYLIHQAISNLCAGKTVIVIAHTLRNIKNADEIIVLDHGEIRERGCHSELMELDGKYAHMYELQKKSLVWEVCQAACSTR
jgi:ATP-binding cassette subfamily B protein